MSDFTRTGTVSGLGVFGPKEWATFAKALRLARHDPAERDVLRPARYQEVIDQVALALAGFLAADADWFDARAFLLGTMHSFNRGYPENDEELAAAEARFRAAIDELAGLEAQ